MKIQFEIEMTPEELRRLFGLPDVSKIQDDMLEQLSERLQHADLETMKSMMKPFVFDSIKAGTETYQHFVNSMLKMATMGKVDFSTKEEKPEKPPAKSSSRASAAKRKK